MAYQGLQTTSLHGRRFGLQVMSTSVTGSGRAGNAPDFLIGPEDIRKASTTNDTTGVNLTAYGQSYLQGTSVGSSSVYVLDPPIPGVHKVVAFNITNQPMYVKTANGEVFLTSAGSTFTVLKGAAGVIDLVGITTAIWGAPDALGFTMSTTT